MSAERAREDSGERHTFPRIARITGSDEIRTLFRRGKRRKTRHLDVFLDSSPVARSRLGLVVPKHRRTAVERNRLKRRLREIGRTMVLPRLDAAGMRLDVMIRARSEAYTASFAELRDEMDRVVEGICSSG